MDLFEEALTDRIIGAAIEVHRQLGPGLLESTYEACLDFELRERRGVVALRGHQSRPLRRCTDRIFAP